MKHIFLSYSPKDVRYMTTMRDNLMRIGYRPWIDPDPRPGQDWRFAIDDAIRSSDAMIVIVSPAAAESVYVTYEWSLALGAGVPVIPVIFKPARMHPRLNTLEHFDFTGFKDERHFWEYFIREIQRTLHLAPRPQTAPPMPPQAAPVPTRSAPPVPEQPSFTRTVMPTESGFYLVMRRGPRLNAMYKLNKELITLGRDATNDIAIDDAEVSRFHLRLIWQGNGYAIEDLGSTNGTRINGGARVQGMTPLQPGSALMLGDALILSYEAVP